MRPDRAQYALALLLDAVGAGGALLVSTRVWQSILTVRPRPFRDDLLAVSGRTLDGAPTALAVAALAGVIAVVATRGWPRRLVGAVLVLDGVALAWRSLTGLRAVGADRARTLVLDRHPGVQVGAASPHVTVHGSWAVLSAVGGLVVVCAGLLVLARGHRWAAMSARYEPPAAAPAPGGVPDAARGDAPAGDGDDVELLARERWRSNAALWTALDRGDDPTAGASEQLGPRSPAPGRRGTDDRS